MCSNETTHVAMANSFIPNHLFEWIKSVTEKLKRWTNRSKYKDGKCLHFCSQGAVAVGYVLVTATWRFAFPSSITSMTSSGLDTNLSVAPCKTQSSPITKLIYMYAYKVYGWP